MKHLFYTLVFLLVSTTYGQIVSIPDTHFKDRLLNHVPVIDTNSNGEIEVSEAEALTTTLDLGESLSSPGSITDLTGIEAFSNITELSCQYNTISTLDLSGNMLLTAVNCTSNAITTVNLVNNPLLEIFDASENLFTSLDLSNNTQLSFLQANFGQLNTIDLSNNPNLLYCYLQGNALTALNLDNNPLLDGVIIDDNNITALNLTNNILLRFIYCRNNAFTSLDLSNSADLITLDCKGNTHLTYLNLKSGNNGNLNITGTGPSCNFENLPLLDTVCLDNVNSPLADFITAQAGHDVTFTETCTFEVAEEEKLQLMLSPNPTTGIIQVTASNELSGISIYNMMGQLILETNNNNDSPQIDLSHYANGMYLLIVTDTATNKAVHKILKI